MRWEIIFYFFLETRPAHADHSFDSCSGSISWLLTPNHLSPSLCYTIMWRISAFIIGYICNAVSRILYPSFSPASLLALCKMEKISQHAGHVIAVNLLIKHASHISLLRVSGLEPSPVFLQSILALLHKFACERYTDDTGRWIFTLQFVNTGFPFVKGILLVVYSQNANQDDMSWGSVFLAPFLKGTIVRMMILVLLIRSLIASLSILQWRNSLPNMFVSEDG